MPDLSGGFGEYVVELDVEGIAIVSVLASSAVEAETAAAERVGPSDVTELDVVEVSRVVGPFPSSPATRRLPWYRGIVRRSKAASHERQA